MPEDNLSPLERLNQRIYQNKDVDTVEVPAYSPYTQEQVSQWTPAPAPPPPPPKKPGLPWTLKFLIGAAIFFVFAGIATAIFLFLGGRAISNDQVAITVSGVPTAIASGDTATFVVAVENKNPTEIRDARLNMSFPEGSRSGADTSDTLEQYTEPLGTIAPGESVTRTVSVKLFGAEGQLITIPLRVEYRAEGSNAVFQAESTHGVTISSSPLSIQVATLSESASGQPLTLTVSVRSNATAPIDTVAVQVQYPSGFIPTNTSLPSQGAGYFPVGSFAPGETKTLRITGSLSGEAGESRAFRVSVGNASSDGTSRLGVSFAESITEVRLTRPFINVALSLNREAADQIIVPAGELVLGLLTFENSLSVPVRDAQISVALSGNGLDPASIETNNGVFRAADNTVLFTQSTSPALAALSPGDSGAGSLSFRPKSADALSGVRNPTITVKVTTSGMRAEGGSAPQPLTSSFTRTIKVGTGVALSSEIEEAGGASVEGNAYTVTLRARNTLNSVGGARVSFSLPEGVRFVGSADTITFNDTNRTAQWAIGDLAPGAEATATFSIVVLSGVSGGGTSARIVSEQSFTGVDRFTQQPVTAIAPALSTDN